MVCELLKPEEEDVNGMRNKEELVESTAALLSRTEEF